MLKPDQKKSNLVTTIDLPYKIKWIIAFLSSIVIIFTIFITFTSEEININRPPFNTLDGHRQKVISYQRQPEINCVIVGSSLSQFFREEYFDFFSAFNLSFSGGSALSGLELINGFDVKPKVILIESNVIFRSADKELVEEFSNLNKYNKSINYKIKYLHPIKTILSKMLNKGLDPFVMISNPKPICDDPECLRDRAAMFLSQTSESLSRNSQGSHQSDSINPPNYQDPTFIDTHQNEAQRIQNIERVMELAVSFSKQDIQIVFYELPLADIYRNSSYVQDVREIIKRNIKTFNMNPIITFDISEKNLTWPDGHHLDERSSIIVGRNLEQKVRNLINLKK